MILINGEGYQLEYEQSKRNMPNNFLMLGLNHSGFLRGNIGEYGLNLNFLINRLNNQEIEAKAGLIGNISTPSVTLEELQMLDLGVVGNKPYGTLIGGVQINGKTFQFGTSGSIYSRIETDKSILLKLCEERDKLPLLEDTLAICTIGMYLDVGKTEQAEYNIKKFIEGRKPNDYSHQIQDLFSDTRRNGIKNQSSSQLNLNNPEIVLMHAINLAETVVKGRKEKADLYQQVRDGTARIMDIADYGNVAHMTTKNHIIYYIEGMFGKHKNALIGKEDIIRDIAIQAEKQYN